MSYYTNVEIRFSGETPPFAAMAECVRTFFDSKRYAIDDIVSDIEREWTNGRFTVNGLAHLDLEGLIGALSSKYPELRMYVRGAGEEPRDLWLREFQAGKIIFSGGPFEPEAIVVPQPEKKRGFWRGLFG